MERMNKPTLLGDLLFSERKGRNLRKSLAAWCWRFAQVELQKRVTAVFASKALPHCSQVFGIFNLLNPIFFYYP